MLMTSTYQYKILRIEKVNSVCEMLFHHLCYLLLCYLLNLSLETVIRNCQYSIQIWNHGTVTFFFYTMQSVILFTEQNSMAAYKFMIHLCFSKLDKSEMFEHLDSQWEKNIASQEHNFRMFYRCWLYGFASEEDLEVICVVRGHWCYDKERVSLNLMEA